jgi:hypothetical protein
MTFSPKGPKSCAWHCLQPCTVCCHKLTTKRFKKDKTLLEKKWLVFRLNHRPPLTGSIRGLFLTCDPEVCRWAATSSKTTDPHVHSRVREAVARAALLAGSTLCTSRCRATHLAAHGTRDCLCVPASSHHSPSIKSGARECVASRRFQTRS